MIEHRSNAYHKERRALEPEHYAMIDKRKYEKSAEKRKAYEKESRKINPERYMLRQVKARAKRLGVSFNLTVEDILIPEVCPILGIPLFLGEGKLCSNSPSLDRVDNSIGYLSGNVRVISFKANRYKSDLTIEEVRKLLNYMES